MRLLTRAIFAKSAVARYKSLSFVVRYPRYNETLKALEDLGANPNPDEVERLTYGDVYCSPGYCWECNEKKEEMVELTSKGGVSVRLCARCLLAALELLEEP
jgi:hypothetical protein